MENLEARQRGSTYLQDDRHWTRCTQCGKGICGGEYYIPLSPSQSCHKACFTCSSCRAALGSTFYPRDGRLFCGLCVMKPRSSSRGSVQVSNPLLEQNAVRIQQTYASPTLRSSASRVRELESSKDEYYYWTQQQENAELAWPANAIKGTPLLVDHGWPVELGSVGVSALDIGDRYIELNTAYYLQQLSLIEHKHFYVASNPPCILSMETKGKIMGQDKLYRALIWSAKCDERVLICVPADAPNKARTEALRESHPSLEAAAMSQVPKSMHSALSKDMMAFEEKLITTNFKFGVLYWKDGETEDDMYKTDETSPEFEKFLTLLGEKVELTRHQGYAGGLSTKDNSTGTHFVYTQYKNFQIAYHVANMIPVSNPDVDTQRIGRKRHLGNDVVLIIFKDAYNTTPFSPDSFTSHFNHVFIVIQPFTKDGQTSYGMAIISKPGVKCCKPFLPHPAIFPHNSDFREYLITKMINAELASLNSPEFLSSLRRTRGELLAEIIEKYWQKAAKKSAANSK